MFLIKFLTRSGTGSIQIAFGNAFPFHESIDLMRLNFMAPDPETKPLFITSLKSPVLLLPHDRFHLGPFNVFVLFPLAETQSILPDSGSDDTRVSSVAIAVDLSEGVLGFETKLPLYNLFYLRKWYILGDVELNDTGLIRLPILSTQCGCLSLACFGCWSHHGRGDISDIAQKGRNVPLMEVGRGEGIRLAA